MAVRVPVNREFRRRRAGDHAEDHAEATVPAEDVPDRLPW
jgi:hypothetical protein